MTASPIDHLAAFKGAVRDFLDESGMAESRFGDLACNDRCFVKDLESGREPRQSTMRKVLAFIDEQRAAANGRGVGVSRRASA